MRTFLFSLFVFIATVCSCAQTAQLGFVKEYNEKAQKTPLPGVELKVRSAGSTVSDNNGAFTLKFLTIKPGEKINVRRIEKLGYEVFNKEAIEQWNLNPKNPFLIIMCRSDKFKKIRDNYERVSSESYARQLRKEEAALAKLKNEGKLKESDYQKQLFNLRENYEKQLDNLENYVDRFSRIDLSELNKTEQEIVELVQQGHIEEAIAKYEEQNYVDKYGVAVSELNVVSNAIDRLTEVQESKIETKDDLLQRIYRYVGTLRLAGGLDNFNKIDSLLHDVVQADTTNSSTLWEYIVFLHEQNNYSEMYRYLDAYLAMDISQKDRIEALRRKVLVCINMDNLAEGENVISELNNISVDFYSKQDNSLTAFEIANIDFAIGSLYMSCQHPEKAKPILEKCVSLLPEFSLSLEKEQIGIWLKCHAGYCYCCLKNGNRSKFSSQVQSLLFTAKALIKSGYELDATSLKSIVDIAQLLELNKQFDEAKVLYKYVEDIYKRNIESNPRKILPLYANLVSAEGILLHKAGEYDEAEKKYLEAIELYNRAYQNMPRHKDLQVRRILNNYSVLLTKTKQFDKALDISKKAFSIAQQNYSEAPFYYMTDYKYACISMARLYDEINEVEEAEKLYIEADGLAKAKFAEIGNSYIEQFWIDSMELPLFYFKTAQHSKLIPVLERLLKYGEQFISTKHRLYEPYITFVYFLGRAYRITENYEKAKTALAYYVACRPQDFIGYLDIARVEATIGNIEDAKKYLDKALAINSDALKGIADDDILLSIRID